MRRLLAAAVVIALTLPFSGTADTTVGPRFAIAATPGMEGSISLAFDGTNFLVGIQGDAASHANVTAQLVSQSGTLVGQRISVGRTGNIPHVAFDGTNYLMVWSDDPDLQNEDVYGQLISPSGSLIGLPFPISQAPGQQEVAGLYALAYDGTNYLVVWLDFSGGENNREVRGQLVSRTGALVGPEIPLVTVGENFDDLAVAFDGTDYLLVWLERRTGPELWDLKGRFVTKAGVPLDPFVISEAPSDRQNPVGLAFDGANYLVAWSGDRDIYGRMVSPSGTPLASELTISARRSGNQIAPFVAFGGNNYLVTWTDAGGASPVTNSDIRGRFIGRSGDFAGSEFPINTDAGNQIGSAVAFGGGKHVVVWNSGVTDTGGTGGSHFLFGDVFGAFVLPDTRPGKLSVSPAKVNFKKVRAGQRRTKGLLLRNTGYAPLMVQVGTPQPPFSVVSGGGTQQILPRGRMTVTLEFAPAQRGSFGGVLPVTSDDPLKPIVEIPLTGAGI